MTVQTHLANEDLRYFNGMVKRFSQGHSDAVFTTYHAEVVPKPWLLTKTIQSRIFQNMSVPDILTEVLSGYDVTFQLYGNLLPAQLLRAVLRIRLCFRQPPDGGRGNLLLLQPFGRRPPDGDLGRANRLSGRSRAVHHHLRARPRRHRGGHADQNLGEGAGAALRPVHGAGLLLRDAHRKSGRKQSHPRPRASGHGDPQAQSGRRRTWKSTSTPGGYAKRYDAVRARATAYAQGFSQMFDDRSRIVRVRMEEEECASLEITGTSDCGNFSAGYTFTLQGHPNGDGDYLLTRVEHHARQSGYRTEEKDEFTYDNRFVCMPTGLVYRPRRVTPKPVIEGVQTATMTGAPDTQYLRPERVLRPVRARQGAISLGPRRQAWTPTVPAGCEWRRVWAGNGWGAFFWPRTSQRSGGGVRGWRPGPAPHRRQRLQRRRTCRPTPCRPPAQSAASARRA